MDDAQLIERAHCERSVIDDPDGRLAPEQVFALWDEAYRLSGDDHLALHVASAMPAGAYRVLEYLVQSAPTYGAACAKICEYFSWIDSSARLVIVERDELVGLSLEVDAPPERMPLRAIEFTFAVCYEKTKSTLGGSVPVARVDWAGTEPGEVGPLAEFLGCAVHRNATGNQILFERATWNRATLGGDAILHELLDEHAQGTLRDPSLPQTSEGQHRTVVHQVRAALEAGGPNQEIAQVAKRLGLSVRTLQRRLSEQKTVFGDVVDQVRAHMARALVENPEVALVEAAFLLGFSDQSSFTRSFKRWTGHSPSAHRACARAKFPHARVS